MKNNKCKNIFQIANQFKSKSNKKNKLIPK